MISGSSLPRSMGLSVNKLADAQVSMPDGESNPIIGLAILLCVSESSIPVFGRVPTHLANHFEEAVCKVAKV